jgi:uncharacterized membrane protein YphA (DoxX/SURF4 family)
MQRIFSTFPDGWPGCGLLLLRLAGSAPVFLVGAAPLLGTPGDAPLWLRLFSCTVGVSLLLGLWTPLAASCQAIIEILLALTGVTFESTYLIHALIGLSLVMLGPGSWSIDARLYGRKRIYIDRLRRER